MASRGPGASNATLGLHVASQEAIPLVLLVGQVDMPNLNRDGVQAIGTGRAFRWPYQVVHQNRFSGLGARDDGARILRGARRHARAGGDRVA